MPALTTGSPDHLVDVLDLIRFSVATTRPELARVTGLGRTIVAQRVATLMEAGLVIEGAPAGSTGGRPSRNLRFNAAAGCLLVAELGATAIHAAITDLSGDILDSRNEEADIAEGPEPVLTSVERIFRSLMDGRPDCEIWGIGIGLPGPVEFSLGSPTSPPIMPGWDDFVLRALETKDAVGAIVHFPDREKLSTVLHPCFLAVRRSFLASHRLDLRQLPDADPCARITEYLIDQARFHEGHVAPLLPTAHEVQLFPDTHERVFGSNNLRHGFGTTYGDLVLHLWFWREVRRRRPVRSKDGTVLVDVEQMEKVLASLRSKFVADPWRKPRA
jgi:hypothetical protein